MKKLIIGLMLAVMLAGMMGCGADGRNNGNVSQSGNGSIVPDRTEMPEKEDDTILPDDSGEILPDDGDAIIGGENADGNGAENGGTNNGNGTENGGTNNGGAADPDGTVIPELVPSESPAASPKSETAQK